MGGRGGPDSRGHLKVNRVSSLFNPLLGLKLGWDFVNRRENDGRSGVGRSVFASLARRRFLLKEFGPLSPVQTVVSPGLFLRPPLHVWGLFGGELCVSSQDGSTVGFERLVSCRVSVIAAVFGLSWRVCAPPPPLLGSAFQLLSPALGPADEVGARLLQRLL